MQLSLPPGTSLSIRVPNKELDGREFGEIVIKNRFCKIVLTTRHFAAGRFIGEYRLMSGLSDAQAQDLATDFYVLRATVHYTRWLSGHPDMKAHRRWAEQLVNALRDQFDEELIWQRVKENDRLAQLHPEESRRRESRRFVAEMAKHEHRVQN